MRNGQWVMFSCRELWAVDAHRARNGKVVGIGQDGVQYGGEQGNPFIAVVAPSGENLTMNINGQIRNIQVHPDQPGLAPVTDRRDLPLERVKKALAVNPNWQPQP